MQVVKYAVLLAALGIGIGFAGAADLAFDETGIKVDLDVRNPYGDALTVQVEWTRPATEGLLMVRGAWAEVVASSRPAASEKVASDAAGATFQSSWLELKGVERASIEVDLQQLTPGEQVLVVAERRTPLVSWQVVTPIRRTDEGVEVGTTRAYRMTSFAEAQMPPVESGDGLHARNQVKPGSVLVESLGKAAPVPIFEEDNTVRNIDDGPNNCANSSTYWESVAFYINEAPPTATNDSITVHVTITHPHMEDMQVAFFYNELGPGGNGVFLVYQGSGSNLDRDFTRDYSNHTLPGLNASTNAFYTLGVRDCDAGNTGTLDYWSLLLEYDGSPTIDLVANSASLSASSVAAGNTVSLNWSGSVGGSGTVGGDFNTAFFLSSDATYGGGDTWLSATTISSAQDPGDTFGEAARNLTIPGGTADGSYYVLAVVDSQGTVTETNENNNVVSAPLTVAPQQAIDLVADSVSVSPTSVDPGGSIALTFSGRVQGTGTVGSSFTLGFYLSANTTVDGSDVVLSRRTSTWGNNPGDTFGEAGFAVTVPGSTAPGSYFLLFMVDDDNLISETNENNNVAMYSPVTVTGSAGTPNLVAQTCSVNPATVAVAGSTTLSWYGRNNGTADSGNFNRKVFLSSDPQFNSGVDRVLSTQATSSWPAGSPNTQYTDTVNLPNDVTAGMYYLGIALDTGNVVAESNENDNSCSSLLTVTGGGGGGGGGGGAVTRWLLPAAASAPGSGGSDWRSQVAVVNPTSSSRQVNVYYVADGANWPGTLLSGPHTLNPNRSLFLEDPLLSLSPTAGLVYVDLDDAGPVVTSRTFNLGGDGSTFGQGIPAMALDGTAPPDELILPMVHTAPGQFHTNLGLVQTSAGSFSVEVSIYTNGGSLLGSKTYTRSQAYDQINDVFNDMGLGSLSMSGAWIRVRLVSGSPSSWTCYASVVDDRTGDPTFVGPVPNLN